MHNYRLNLTNKGCFFLVGCLAALVSGFVVSLVIGAPTTVLADYSSDVTSSAYYIESSHSGTSSGSYAFSNNATVWISGEAWNNTNGVSYVGQDFGAQTKEIRRVGIIAHGGASWDVSSYVLQYSDDCANWYSVSIATLTDTVIEQYAVFDALGSHRCWRVLANSNTSGYPWYLVEVEMFEYTPNYTETPTVTVTPSATPSPTPQIEIVSTLSSGSYYAIARSATFGDIGVFMAIGIMCVILIVSILIQVLYGKR